MTRPEIVGSRDLGFSGWVRDNLPKSNTGFSVSDLDFIMWNWKTNHVMLLEIKTLNAVPRKGQHLMWQRLHKWIGAGIDDDWTYLGFHLIRFERTNFLDGRVFFDHDEVTEEELIQKLSF